MNSEPDNLSAKGAGHQWTPFPLQLWHNVRPYLLRFSEDFLIFAIAWLLLGVAQWLEKQFPVHGTAAELLTYAHEAAVVVSFYMLVALMLFDLVTLRARQRHE